MISLLIGACAPAAFAADAWDVKNVSYDDIEDLVEDCVNFTDAVSELESASSSLSSYAATLTSRLSTLEPGSTEYQSVSNQLALVKASLIQIGATTSILQQSMGGKNTSHDVTVIAAKSLFISFNSLRDQLNEMLRKQTVFNANLSNIRQLHDGGYVSDLELEQTKAQGDSLQANIQAMQSQLEALKRSFNSMLGRNYNHSLDIHPLPFARLSDVSKIKFKDDLADALAIYPGDTSGSAYKNPDYDEEKGSFAASFRKLYDAVNDKNNLLAVEQKALEVEQKNFDASKKLYDAGLLSQLSLINAQDPLDTQRAKVKAAQTALFSAYEKYQWAVQYGIISES
ncbi:TolC family protein [Caproiciproducens galactitolivorans]|uniref:Outer membrane efflux protein n=1 Tax=Caproiciproducens galactitolivorans TaxID=642589 RepID=A0A4Z0Y007_9FIRM|nr:TolC family protein [Caproiciproducens galactitolivorans]QEY35495.1 TolC family protein [Caproiciproducens galactitolivorans]TGJ77209.1 hypothetical protein CAGA_05770 [Caproiciproducens galactitolivorans]